MAVSQLNFNALLTQKGSWRPTGAGYIVAIDDSRHLVSNEELQERHPDLPRTLQSLHNVNGCLFSVHVARLLFIWDCSVQVRTTDSDMMAIAVPTHLNVGVHEVSLDGYALRYRVVRCSITGVDFILPMGTHQGHIQIDTRWLDTEHPGWRERYETSKLLDCTTLETLEHMTKSCITTLFLPTDTELYSS